MPEQLTKHPDVTLQVLGSAGAKCGVGEKQEILTRCPAERFCKLPGGEVCVYGLSDAPRMTQLTPSDWQTLAAATAPAAAASVAAQAIPASAPQPPPAAWPLGAVSGAALLLVGIAIGRLWRRRR